MPARRRGSAFRTPTQRAQLWEKKMDGETYSRILSRTKHLALPRITEYQAVHENLISIVKSVLERLGKSHQTHEYMWYAEELYKATQTYTGQALQNKVNAIYAKYRAQKLDDDALMKIANSFGLTPDPIEKIFEIPLAVPGKGAPLVVVAAADTPSFLKDRADIICDGVSDQEDINSAFSFAPTVYLCPGTYVIDGPIVIPSHVQLIGAGPSSVIKLKDNYNADINMIYNSDPVNGNTEITISNLTIDGNKQNQAGGNIIGIYLYNVTSSKVESCTLKNTNDIAIHVIKSEEVALLENTFLEHNTTLWARESNHLTISRNTCTSFEDCFVLDGCNNCVISENSFKMGTYEAIWLDGYKHPANYNVISGNHFLNSGDYGIFIDFAHYNVISENICINTSYDGIALYFSNNNVFIRNYCENNYFAGIEMYYSIDNLIIGNYLHKNTSYGIYLYKSSYNLISGNTIRSGGVTGYGIYIAGSESTLNVIEGNNLYQSGTEGDILDSGTDTRRRDNIGNDGSWLADA